MKTPEKVIEIRNSLTPDEIREEIKKLNNSKTKDAYTYLMLAQNYWAIDELQNAGKMYETGLNAPDDVSDAAVRTILEEELEMLKRSTPYKSAASAPKKDKSKLILPISIVAAALILAVGAIIIVAIINGGKPETASLGAAENVPVVTYAQTASEGAAQITESAQPSENVSILPAETQAESQLAESQPAAASTFSPKAEDFGMVNSKLYDMILNDFWKDRYDEAITGEKWVRGSLTGSMVPKAPALFGAVKYTIKDESMADNKNKPEYYFAIYKLEVKESSPNTTFERYGCYEAIEVTFNENGSASIVRDNTKTAQEGYVNEYFAPKLDELYQTLTDHYGLYNAEIVEFDK